MPKALRAFSIPAAVIALACVTSPAGAGQQGTATADARTDRLASFRPDFNKEKLEALTPAPGSGAPRAPDTPGFPGAPPILSQCNNIAHSSEFTFGALVAWQVLRTVLATATFICLEDVVVAGEGGNGAAACVPFAIAQDAAAIPYELASFCGGEEDSALAQGSYDRLEHIHNDIEAARVQIITEMRNLSCDLERLLHTPEGQRQSSIAECTGQPFFPYDFPIHPPHK